MKQKNQNSGISAMAGIKVDDMTTSTTAQKNAIEIDEVLLRDVYKLLSEGMEQRIKHIDVGLGASCALKQFAQKRCTHEMSVKGILSQFNGFPVIINTMLPEYGYAFIGNNGEVLGFGTLDIKEKS